MEPEAKSTAPVDYKIVDQAWSPGDPSVAETMLNEQGQDGWQLIIAYPDPIRERTRWILGRGKAT
jgi:hypothetical protein